MDPRKLAAKLEELAENVAKRPVYLALTQGQGEYKIIEHLSQKELLTGLPNKHIAETLALRMNNKKQVPPHKLKRARGILSDYHKHHTDMQYYEHTMQHSDDEFRRETARIRLDYTGKCLQKTLGDLERSL